MAVSNKRTASHAFSIDSLMSPDRQDSLSPQSKSCSSVTPPTSPGQINPLSAQLMGLKALYESQYLAQAAAAGTGGLESMGLGLNHPIFAGALPSSLPGHMPSLPAALNPALLYAGAQREQLFNPWLQFSRHPLAHRFGKYQSILEPVKYN